MDPEFLQILVCPQTHQPLREATSEELQALNGKIEAGAVKNQGGGVVEQVLSAGLVREDAQVIYPIRDEIPVLLAEEAISMA